MVGCERDGWLCENKREMFFVSMMERRRVIALSKFNLDKVYFSHN